MIEPARQVSSGPDTLALIKSRLGEPLAKVEETIRELVLGGEEATHQLLAGAARTKGKKIRPILVLLTAEAFGGPMDAAIDVAAGCEMVHVATLLHDDVVDNAATRRGQPSLQSIWGNKLAVLGGDYMFARAFRLLLRPQDTRLIDSVTGMVAALGEGEIMQVFRQFDVEVTEADYFERIKRKTAIFMSCCCEMGGFLSGCSDAELSSLAGYGMALGMAFQVVDDLLDFTGDEATVGKPVASDLLEGNLTLPIIHALAGPHGAEIAEQIGDRPITPERVAHLLGLVERSGSLSYTRDVSERFAREAHRHLAALPQNEAVATLGELADYLLGRDF